MALKQISIETVKKQFLALVSWRTQLHRMVFDVMQNSVRGQSSLGNVVFTDFFSYSEALILGTGFLADGLRLLNFDSAHLTQSFAVLPGYIRKSIN